MAQKIQILRRFTGVAGNPALIAPGELAYNSAGETLVIGDAANTARTLVAATRQVEMAGDQPGIAGNKGFAATGLITIPIANLKASGGAANDLVKTDGAGNLSFTPPVAATQTFAGSFDASAGTILWVAGTGTGNALPAPTPANKGWYLIANVAGSTPPGTGPVGAYEVGDWLISSGTAWTHLFFGGSVVTTASDVGVSPVVASGANVQDALEGLEAADAAFVVGPALSVLDNLAAFTDALGHTIKDTGTKIADLATKAYVDASQTTQDTAQAVTDDAQDLLIAANTAAIATKGDVTGPTGALADHIAVYNLATGKIIKDGGQTIAEVLAQAKTYVDAANLAQDTVIGTKGNVNGPAISAVDSIATYNNITGTLIKDGGTSLPSLLAQVAGKTDKTYVDAENAKDVKIAGSTMTGVLILSEHPAAADPPFQATTKQYVDDAVAAVSAGASVTVVGPELTGTGLSIDPITFNGITAEALVFGGDGLVATPLTLLVVDAGEY